MGPRWARAAPGPATAMLASAVVLVVSRSACGSGADAACRQPIRPVLSAPHSTGINSAGRVVNQTHGQYLLVAEPAYEYEQTQLRSGADEVSSWSGEDTEMVSEPVAAEDWLVVVYCKQTPDMVLGSIKLQARLNPEPFSRQPWEAAAALERGAIIATDTGYVHFFGWNDIAPCLPQTSCSAIRPAHYYEKETHISRFIAFVAVGTIALTSMSFICLTILRQPCWSESTYDDQYWESSIDLEKLEPSRQFPASNTQTAEIGAGTITTSTDAMRSLATSSAIGRIGISPNGQKASHLSTPTGSLAPAANTCRPTTGVAQRPRGVNQLGAPDGSSSDGSVDSFDSAHDGQTAIHSGMT